MNQTTIVNVQTGHGCRHRPGRSGLVLLWLLFWVVAEFWVLSTTALAVLFALALRMGRPEDITMTQLPWGLWMIDLRITEGGDQDEAQDQSTDWGRRPGAGRGRMYSGSRR